MNFWQQLLIAQASAAIHAVVRMFGVKYFTPEELAAFDVVVDALVSLPERVHAPNTPTLGPTVPKSLKGKKK